MSRENSKIFTYAICKSGALQFWILERFCLWILYTLFNLVLLRHQGGVF
jgi:hypothetical protein